MARITPGECGNTLRATAVTVDGYTLDNPYGAFAIYTDIAGWQQLARELLTKCRTHFAALGEIERMRKISMKIPDASDYPRWNALVDLFNAIVAKVDDLDSHGGILSGNAVLEAIAYCTDLVADELCFLEQVDAAILGYGGTPPAIPGTIKPAPPPSSSADWRRNALIAGVVLIVLLYALRR